jgi:hypothetical protein
MSISSEGEDGPVVLQLKKWQDSIFQFDLSEFHEGFISPSRRMLLLLSNKFEATLVSLSSGTLSESSLARGASLSIFFESLTK